LVSIATYTVQEEAILRTCNRCTCSLSSRARSEIEWVSCTLRPFIR